MFEKMSSSHIHRVWKENSLFHSLEAHIHIYLCFFFTSELLFVENSERESCRLVLMLNVFYFIARRGPGGLQRLLASAAAIMLPVVRFPPSTSRSRSDLHSHTYRLNLPTIRDFKTLRMM